METTEVRFLPVTVVVIVIFAQVDGTALGWRRFLFAS